MTTNVAKEFLKLIDQCFPPGHRLRKIFNRQTVKVSYSGTPNMSQIIAGHNAKVLKQEEQNQRECSCPKTKTCPLDKKCLTKNLVYQATVTIPNQEPKKYVGLTSSDFKARLAVHEQTFRDPKASQTSLSKFIRELNGRGKAHQITWKLIDRGKPFSPISGVCQLCLKEKFYILYKPEMATLNGRNEIFNSCSHKKSKLLIKKQRGRKKKSPGS